VAHRQAGDERGGGKKRGKGGPTGAFDSSGASGKTGWLPVDKQIMLNERLWRW
jgi:hypothetical protein